jgi:hypothetical protein
MYFTWSNRAYLLCIIPVKRAVAFPSIRRLVAALLQNATTHAIGVAAATLVALHLIRPPPVKEEEDKVRLMNNQLLLFVRDGTLRLIAPSGQVPPVPWPPRSWTNHALEMLQQEKLHRVMENSNQEQNRYVGSPPPLSILPRYFVLCSCVQFAAPQTPPHHLGRIFMLFVD